MKNFRTFARRLSMVAAATLAGTAGTLALTATPAFAHTTAIHKSWACNTDTGNWDVTWQVFNSMKQPGDLAVASWTPIGAPMTGIAPGAVLPGGPGFTLTGVESVPGSATSASLTVKGHWSFDNFTEPYSHTRWVHFKGTCKKNEPKPHAAFETACSGDVTVTLTNDEDATADANFTVKGDGGFSQSKTVAADGSDAVVVPDANAGTVTVFVGDTQLGDAYHQQIPSDCAQPVVTGQSTCDNLEISIQNPRGGRTLNVIVRVAGSPDRPFTIAPGDGEGVVIPGGPGVVATVLRGDTVLDTFTWENPGNCESPTPSTSPPGLPVTGASLSGLVGVAVALVAVGAVLLLVLRRRRTLNES